MYNEPDMIAEHVGLYTPEIRYVTADGSTHRTPEKAMAYVADRCRDILSKRLSTLPSDRYTANDRYRIIMHLLPSGAQAKDLIAELQRCLID